MSAKAWTFVSYRSRKQRISTPKKHKTTDLETRCRWRHVLMLKPFPLGSPVDFERAYGAWLALQKWRVSDVESITPPHVENEWLGGTSTPFRLLSTHCIIMSPMSCIAPKTCGLGTTPIRKRQALKMQKDWHLKSCPKKNRPSYDHMGKLWVGPTHRLELGGHVFIRKSLGSDEVCGWI